jgi:ABC-type glycerol-3-phosphate transport system permease component
MIETRNFWFYLRKSITYAVITAVAVAMLFPFWYMFIAIFRTNGQISSTGLHLVPELGFTYVKNIVILFQRNFMNNIYNTLFVSVFRAGLTMLLCCMAGLAFSKFRFPGRNVLMYAVVITMMVPSQISVIPNYLLMSWMKWLNTYQALIVPGLASAFGIFMMRQYMSALPDEIIESSRIDGLNEWGILFRMAIPLTRAGITVLGIITFMSSWNDYFWPLIVITKEEMYTATLRMATLMDTGLYDIVPLGAIMCGAFVSSMPMIILFILFRNQMLSGILAGSVKA